MQTERIHRSKPLKGTITVPGDKSISHRAVMLGSIAHGTTTVRGFLQGEDCKRTIQCFRQLGVEVEEKEEEILIHGKGFEGLKEPETMLDVGNSGTTIRLMLGILAGTHFFSTVAGDRSIAKRPMARVTKPLQTMGAKIYGRNDGNLTPLAIQGSHLSGITHLSSVASGQVKSSLLLAGLNASGVTSVQEPYRSRDHTERMLKAFGASVDVTDNKASIKGGQQLEGRLVEVPADISSAAFLLSAATIVPGSAVTLKNVGMNPTRAGIIDVLLAMGANVDIDNEQLQSGEPTADLHVQFAKIHGTTIGGDLIPRLIDELPVIAVLATQAEGRTVIKDAEELKYKETNRIDTVVNQLSELGANVEATADGMIIDGPTPLKSGRVDSFGDHRIGMAFAIAGLISEGVEIMDKKAVDVSYPGFFETLKALTS